MTNKYAKYDESNVMTADELMDFIEECTATGEEVPYGICYVRFTPESARRFLDKHENMRNRRRTATAMAELITAMESGCFDEQTGSAGAIYKDGVLGDAHHRIAAIAAVRDPEYSVVLPIFGGVIRSMFLDTGRRRKPQNNVVMNTAIDDESVELCDGLVGKMLNSLYRLAPQNKTSTLAKIRYLSFAFENILEELKVFNQCYATASSSDNYANRAAVAAALFDKFLKGQLNTKEIETILMCMSEYSDGIKRRNKGKASYVDVQKGAREMEEKFFGTSCLFDMLTENLAKLGSSNKTEADAFYLVSQSIDNWKSNNSSVPCVDNSPATTTGKKMYRQNIYDIFQVPYDNTELVYNKETDASCIVRVA